MNARNTLFRSLFGKSQNIFSQRLHPNTFTVRLINSGNSSKFSQSQSSSSFIPDDYGSFFGFKRVENDQREQLVQSVFSRVARRYDLMNDWMSFGIHRLWKDYFVQSVVHPTAPLKSIDVAGGTGDIAFRILRFASANASLFPPTTSLKSSAAPSSSPVSPPASPAAIPPVHVTVCDLNEKMLAHGKKKAASLASTYGFKESQLDWVHGNAEALPFETNQFDLYTIAFGLRNCNNLEQVLSEAARVLRPGARFLCLEFAPTSAIHPLLRWPYEYYSMEIIPAIGELVASDWHAYRYLVESIRRFPTPEKLSAMMRTAGLAGVRTQSLNGGIVYIHSGFKPTPCK
jgi:2-methoxy-6-polyprenyl-1,4-benzoquinol methylase